MVHSQIFQIWSWFLKEKICNHTGLPPPAICIYGSGLVMYLLYDKWCFFYVTNVYFLQNKYLCQYERSILPPGIVRTYKWGKTNKARISDVYLTKWIFMRLSLALGNPPSEILPEPTQYATCSPTEILPISCWCFNLLPISFWWCHHF